MPHQISTELNPNGVVISFSGVISGDEILALNVRLISEESFSQRRYEIWDFSQAIRLDITTEELRSVSMQDVKPSEINPNLKIAIVGQPSFFGGKDRVFLIFEEVWTAYKPKVFLEVEAAREWVAG